MIRIKPIQEISKKWSRNTLKANPERIKGIIEAYLLKKQNFNWITGLLKTENPELSKKILDSLRGGDPICRNRLSNWLDSFK